MSSQRTLTWWESPRDLDVLAETRFNLNISIEVEADDDNSKPNVVFRSQVPVPQVQIKWQPKYALSFTRHLPPLESIVYLSTPWQACEKGDTYNLDTCGFFSKSDDDDNHPPGKGDSLVVVNKYPVALHFVIGMYSEDKGRYDPVFVDVRRLEPGRSASYRPTGRAVWWLDRPLVSGSFFDGARRLGAVCSDGFEDRRGVRTTFDLAEGRWNVEDCAAGS